MNTKLFQPIILAVLLSLALASCSNQVKRLHTPKNGLTFAFYNVENLFDTIDDQTINDEEFLPSAKGQWNTAKLNRKLDNIARVISSMDTTDFPDMLGLAEIENVDVLKMLVSNQLLEDADYQYIHYADHDPRGIEVAFMYRPEFFRPVYSTTLDYTVDSLPNANPRHILYIKGIDASDDTLHLFINHWTSRFGGKDETVPSRNAAGSFMRKMADSLFAKDANTNIIIAGDLNDNPDDVSLMAHLKALPVDQTIGKKQLYNLAFNPFKAGNGTLYYKSWDFFDQIIVSSNLLMPDKGKLKTGEIQIVNRDWMLFFNKNGVGKPNRTYSGGKYFGGYSDHLPVMIRLSGKSK